MLGSVMLLITIERFVLGGLTDGTFVALMALGIRVGLFLLGCLPLVYAASREVKMSSLSATLATWRER